MQEKITAIQALLAVAQEENEFGGCEDAEGCMHPGLVDFDELEERIICVLEDREYNPQKREILPHTIINPVVINECADLDEHHDPEQDKGE